MDIALMEQQETQRPILFYFVSSGNLYCQLMARSTFADDTITRLINNNYIPVLIHINQRGTKDLPSGRRLAEAFRIKSAPAMVLVNADHRAIDIRIGFVTARAAGDFLEKNVNPLTIPGNAGGQPDE